MHDDQNAARRSRRALAVRGSVSLVLGAGIFVVVHRDAGVGAVVETVLALRPGPLGWAALLALGGLLLRTDQLRVLVTGESGPERPDPGWPRLFRNVLSEAAPRGFLDPRVSVKIQGRLLERELPWVTAGRLVTQSRFGNVIGLGLVGACGLTWAGAKGSLVRWELWSGALVVAATAGFASLAAPVVRRMTEAEDPPESFQPDEARAHYVLRATLREGAGSWTWVLGVAVALAAVEVSLLHFLFQAVGVGVEPARLAAVAPAMALMSYYHFTFAGLGLRDLPLVWMLGGYAAAPALAAVGVLAALRVALQAVAGLPALAGGCRT